MCERGLSRFTLACSLKISDENMLDLLNGKFLIDDDMAHRLSEVFGSTPQFWKNRENQYREKMKREEPHRARVSEIMTVPHPLKQEKYFLISENVLDDISKYARGSWVDVVRSRPYNPTTSAAEQVLDRLEKWALSQIKFDEKTGRALWSPNIRNEELLEKIQELRQQERERG